MKIAEFRALLAVLPDDMLVTINSRHVVMVERRFRNAGTGIRSVPCSCTNCDHPHTRYEPARYDWPERLELSHSQRDPRGDEQDPPVYYRGRWTRAMRVAIDAFSDDPDAAPSPQEER